MTITVLKYHIKTIVIDQALSNSALFEQIWLQNINKLYQHAGKCYYQQQFKDILEASKVSTPEVFIDNSPRSPTTPTPVKKSSARKSLRLLTNILNKTKKLLSVESKMLNQSASQLKQELLCVK